MQLRGCNKSACLVPSPPATNACLRGTFQFRLSLFLQQGVGHRNSGAEFNIPCEATIHKTDRFLGFRLSNKKLYTLPWGQPFTYKITFLHKRFLRLMTHLLIVEKINNCFMYIIIISFYILRLL